MLDTGPVEIQVDYTDEIKIKTNAALRKANIYLLTNVTNLSYAKCEPELVWENG